MANCCLLIETLQSFKNGWEDSGRKSEEAFKQFFGSESSFSIFKGNEKSFYVNVRCGILHQGETTGGWKINRDGQTFFDKNKMIISSAVFAQRLEKVLGNYADRLKVEKWDSELWDNFRTKMRKVVSNCKKQ